MSVILNRPFLIFLENNFKFVVSNQQNFRIQNFKLLDRHKNSCFKRRIDTLTNFNYFDPSYLLNQL